MESCFFARKGIFLLQMFVNFSDEWNNTARPRSLLEVINIQFATRAFAFTPQTNSAATSFVVGEQRAQRAASAPGNGAERLSLGSSSLPAPFPGKTRPWKPQGLLLPLATNSSPGSSANNVSIAHYFGLRAYFSWSTLNLWDLFMFFSHCVRFFLVFLQGKPKWLTIKIFF